MLAPLLPVGTVGTVCGTPPFLLAISRGCGATGASQASIYGIVLAADESLELPYLASCLLGCHKFWLGRYALDPSRAPAFHLQVLV